MSKGSRYYLPTDEGWLDVDCDQYDFPCQLDLEFSKFLTDTEIQTVANSVLPDASLFLRVCLFDSLAALCRSVIVFYQLHGIVLWSLIESSYIVGLDWFITDMIQALIREIVARIDDVFLFLFLKQFNLISFIIFPLYIYIYSFSPFFFVFGYFSPSFIFLLVILNCTVAEDSRWLHWRILFFSSSRGRELCKMTPFINFFILQSLFHLFFQNLIF